MRLFRTKRAVILWLASALCIVLIVYTAGERRGGPVANVLGAIIIPAQTALHHTGSWFSNLGYYFDRTGALLEENARLHEEIEALLMVVSRVELLEANVIEQNEMLQMAERYPRFSTRGASVISRDNNNWNSRFNINLGTADGVNQNTVVVARGGLVGKVVTAAYHFSIVEPIIDDVSSVGAIVARNNVTGLARGDLVLGRDGLLLFEVPVGSDIIIGDEISTSTFGTIFPPGISIGTIVDILPPTQQHIFAVVEPTADFNNLNAVLVILDIAEE